MKELKADVVVVGAGPAGSIAAANLAREGVDVLVLEKKQEIGVPKRCAEGLNYSGFVKHGIEVDPRYAMQKIIGATLVSPTGKTILVKNERTSGYVLERKIFEKHLAAQAIDAGARYKVKTLVTDIIKEGDKVMGVKAVYMGEEFTVKSKIVIAADGVDSMMAKMAGINTVNKITDYHSGYQYEMAGLKNFDTNSLTIFFGNKIAPKGYVWIFPKGGSVGNVGIGIVGCESEDGNRAQDYLDRFIADNPKIFGNASPIEVNAGGIPVSAACDSFVMDGFMVVGDAAQQVNPIHGGGIGLAMDAAKLCAQTAAAAIKEGDCSRERLFQYEKAWREGAGVFLSKLMRIRLFLEKCSDNEFEKIADVITGGDVLKVMSGDYKYLIKLLVTKAPKLLALGKKFLF
ncbi:NAD(P)/FAD-dependent oxidoreductase [Candidatus Altiarchaeota archaeon]